MVIHSHHKESDMKTDTIRYRMPVKIWLLAGVFMVFMQVIIGGITRLTGSGLSITKWEIVTGSIPPIGAAQWQEAFDLYKQTPQYHKINKGMTLGEFKFIYFWEYFHRLWARTMGFVFLFPFIFFWRKGWLDRPLMRGLGIVVLLAALAASFGWIMVASGLVNRPWVNAYKLTMHLSIALSVFAYLLWVTFRVWQPAPQSYPQGMWKKWSWGITILACWQIILGGIMSGMKAGLVFPTWPDMHGAFIPPEVLSYSQWNVENFTQYDTNTFMPALIQVLHRNTAYVLAIIILCYVFSMLKRNIPHALRTGLYMLITVLITQITLGILTLINCIGTVPVGLGVFHQGVAIVLLGNLLFINYQFTNSTGK